jgi:hypothetical protein
MEARAGEGERENRTAAASEAEKDLKHLTGVVTVKTNGRRQAQPGQIAEEARRSFMSNDVS